VAARNDQRIRDAAREVFFADPSAPIAAVAERAGVGIAALYRRYGSKAALFQQLFLDSMHRDNAEAEAALAAEGDPWEVFCRFAHRSLDAGSGVLSLHVAPTFPLTDELRLAARRGYELFRRLVERTQAAGALRSDVTAADIGWLFLPVQAIQLGDRERTNRLRHRYLAILLDGLHATWAAPLPGPPPGWDEFGQVWEQVVPTAAKRGSRPPGDA
jgi:AcrR family transcriptional regulator